MSSTAVISFGVLEIKSLSTPRVYGTACMLFGMCANIG